MARVRMVNPEMFLHEDLAKTSPHARLLFIALWTQADREGRMRWLPLKIHGEAFPHEPKLDIDALGAELVRAGVLVVYLHSGRRYAYLPGFPRWQKPHARERESTCPPTPEEEGSPKDHPGLAEGSPDTEYGIRITENELRNTECSATDDRSRDTSAPKLRLEVPTGDETLDFILEAWPGLLGKHETLERWLKTSRAAYPAVDLLAEARRASAWIESNPSRKKKQVRAFLSKWWSRAQDRGGSSPSSRGSSVEEEALAYARSLGASS